MAAAWWVSWYSRTDRSEFELHSPWWVSGYSDDADILIAAVRASSERAAWDQVRAAYDNPPDISERFIEPLAVEPFSAGWSDRWPQAGWMTWDENYTCRCPACRGED